jgi:hypothetical protein
MGQVEVQPQNEHLTVEGLEEIFVESETVAQPLRESNATLSRGLSFKEACEYYGLKATALRVRIKSGEIPAEKIQGMNGPEWRIYPAQPSRDPFAQITEPHREVIEPNKLLEIVQDLQSKLEAANQQLQAANFRNGYLEAQVESQQGQIKLLVDSQRNRGSWWSGFVSWLRGSDR